MTEQIALIILFISCSAFAIISIYFSIYFFKKLKKLKENQTISENEFKLIKFLFRLYVLLEAPSILFDLLDFNRTFFTVQRFFSLPLYFTLNIIPAYIAFIIFYRKYINSFKKIEVSGNQDQLNDSVKKIFNSIEFYTAISTALPKGEKDEDYGLDYIPFMLQNLQEKRNRFQKSSSKFLTTTICLSIFFIGITISFSYILLNESSIGIYREVKNLSNEIDDTNEIISSLKIDIRDDKYFIKANTYSLEELQNSYKFDLPTKENNIANKVSESINTFNKDGDLGKLKIELEIAEKKLTIINNKQAKNYLEALSRTNKSIIEYLNFKNKGFKKLETTQSDIRALLPKIQEELNKPNNSLNELIKRMILSIVVITFFLAILRYFRNLYQSHYNEMLKAEQQDLMVRKFYVTLKSSENNSAERKLVLSNFLSDMNSSSDLNKNETLKNKNQKIENDVLRDILNAILKKI